MNERFDWDINTTMQVKIRSHTQTCSFQHTPTTTATTTTTTDVYLIITTHWIFNVSSNADASSTCQARTAKESWRQSEAREKKASELPAPKRYLIDLDEKQVLFLTN